MEKARRILIAIKTPEQVFDLVDLASCVSGADSSITVVHVIELPPATPLDADLPEIDASGREILARAEEAARLRGLKIETRLLRARSAGDALLDEMQERQSELAVLGHHHKPKLVESLLGTTSLHLAERAPCQVLISIPPRK